MATHGKALIGVTAALLMLAACDGGGEGQATDDPPIPTAADADAEEIASSFVEATTSPPRWRTWLRSG